MTYTDRAAAIAEAYAPIGAAADEITWPGTPWSPATSVWSAVTGRNGTGLDGTAAGVPPSSAPAVAPLGRGHRPCLARGAVEPGLAGGGR